LKYNYEDGKVRIPLTGLTPLRICIYPKRRPIHQTSMSLYFVVLNELRWGVIIPFVCIGGIV